MIRFWLREIVGWICVGLGILVFYLTGALLFGGRIIEAGPMTVIGIILFRGGVHLLKVAVAADICLRAQRDAARLDGNTAVSIGRPRRPTAMRTVGRSASFERAAEA